MKPTIFYTLAILVSSLSLIPAQSTLGLGLTKTCEQTLTAFVGSPELTSCIPFIPLGMLANSTLSNPSAATSIDPTTGLPQNAISAITNVVTAVCGQAKCNDTVVSDVLSKFNTGCQTDITQKNPVALAVQVFISFYSPIRDSLCFKNSTGQPCVLEDIALAKDVLNTTGSLNSFSLDNIPKQDLCTNCNKAILNTMYNFEQAHPNIIPGNFSQQETQAKSALTSKCGASFLDGSVPVSSSGVVSDKSSSAAPTHWQQNTVYFASWAVLLVFYLTV